MMVLHFQRVTQKTRVSGAHVNFSPNNNQPVKYTNLNVHIGYPFMHKFYKMKKIGQSKLSSLNFNQLHIFDSS